MQTASVTKDMETRAKSLQSIFLFCSTTILPKKDGNYLNLNYFVKDSKNTGMEEKAQVRTMFIINIEIKDVQSSVSTAQITVLRSAAKDNPSEILPHNFCCIFSHHCLTFH